MEVSNSPKLSTFKSRNYVTLKRKIRQCGPNFATQLKPTTRVKRKPNLAIWNINWISILVMQKPESCENFYKCNCFARQNEKLQKSHFSFYDFQSRILRMLNPQHKLESLEANLILNNKSLNYMHFILSHTLMKNLDKISIFVLWV